MNSIPLGILCGFIFSVPFGTVCFEATSYAHKCAGDSCDLTSWWLCEHTLERIIYACTPRS
jgi:hypothetical protein